MHRVVLLRHGESLWNRENRFTGWTDIGLTERGIEEAEEAGRLLREEGYYMGVNVRVVTASKRVLLGIEIGG